MTNQSKQLPATRKQLSLFLGVSVATLRGWESRYASYLEAEPGKKGSAVKKQFTPNDVLVLATVRRLRNDGRSLAEIDTLLDEEIPKTDLDAPGREGGAAPAGELVALNNKLTATIASLAAEEAAREVIQEERDRLLVDVAAAREEAATARDRATAAETELNILKQLTEKPADKPSFWQRLFNRG